MEGTKSDQPTTMSPSPPHLCTADSGPPIPPPSASLVSSSPSPQAPGADVTVTFPSELTPSPDDVGSPPLGADPAPKSSTPPVSTASAAPATATEDPPGHGIEKNPTQADAQSGKPKAKTAAAGSGPGTGRAKRSKHGCRTCRRRRKKCDETRPTCLGCRKLGLECEGYERPLIWGNGIASRGKLKGATVPTMDMWKPTTGTKRRGSTKKARSTAGPASTAESSSMAGPSPETTTELIPSKQLPASSTILPGFESIQLSSPAERASEGHSASLWHSTTADQGLGQPFKPLGGQIPIPIRLQDVHEVANQSRSKIPPTGMSTFMLERPALLQASPVSKGASSSSLNTTQTTNVHAVPENIGAVALLETSPKAASVGSTASSPHIEYVEVFDNLDEPVDQDLYNRLVLEFFTSGHLTLFSADKNLSPVLSLVLPLARESATLRSVCAAYQALLADAPVRQFQALYSSALQQYRADLSNKTARELDSTIYAGLLLCSIGAWQNLPFTFHVQPILKLLVARTKAVWNQFHEHAFEVLGYYDLPSFTINRRAPRLDIWQSFCMQHADRNSVEPVSGLPRSLLDIFATLEDADCEERFWYWHGREGSVMQVHLWDAHRFAGMLKHREIMNDFRQGIKGMDDILYEPSDSKLPPSGVILSRLVASLSVIFRCYTQPDSKDPHLIMNSISYPLFIAGCQIVRLDPPRPEWEEIIKDIFAICRDLKMA
ncbi:hypothetical protein KEM52_000991, partial [Ascosphaera acerosa]